MRADVAPSQEGAAALEAGGREGEEGASSQKVPPRTRDSCTDPAAPSPQRVRAERERKHREGLVVTSSSEEEAEDSESSDWSGKEEAEAKEAAEAAAEAERKKREKVAQNKARREAKQAKREKELTELRERMREKRALQKAQGVKRIRFD